MSWGQVSSVPLHIHLLWGGGGGGREKHAHMGVSDWAILLAHRWTEVDVSWCYWVSEKYYQNCIEYILQCARENEGSSATGADTE